MKFTKRICQIVHLGQCSPVYMYRVWDERLESGPMERDLVVLIRTKLDMSQQSALAAREATAPWGASGTAWPGQGEGLPRSAPCWGGLTSSTVCGFGCHNIRRT